MATARFPPLAGLPVAAMTGFQLESVRELVRVRLRQLGVQWSSKKPSGLLSKRRSHSAATSATPGRGGGCHDHHRARSRTPGRATNGSIGGTNRVFGRPIRDLSMVLASEVDSLPVPKILVFLADWLRADERLVNEGLFRKSGSAARQRSLRAELEATENWRSSLADASPLDVAAVVKQWMRELPEPLLPMWAQKMLLESWSAEDRDEALLLCCCLLPPNHASTVTYLVKFFAEVSAQSEKNLMDASNLAVVLAPAFFPVEDIRKNVADQDQMKQRIGVIEALINLSEDVGYLTKAVADEYTELHIASSLVPEDLPSLDTLGLPNNDADAASANHGPSARRVKKKKRRSGSLSRMFSATVKSIHGITRVISRSATPVAPRRTTWVADDELDFEHSVHETPLAVSKQSTFVSPQVVQPRKRKARRESELSPKTKKQQRADAKSEIATPKAGRGFSIKRKFKEKQRKSFRETTAAAPNAQLEKASALSHNFSPSKPSLLLHSPPPTPANLGIPRQATDIVTPENSKENETSSQVGRQKDFSDADIDEVNVSATSQRTAGDDSSNLSVSSNSTFKSSNDSTGRCNYRPRSPSVEGHMRKIGAARSRSVKTAGAETKPSLCNLPAKNLRSQLRRGMAGHTPAKISSNRPTPLKAPPRPSSHEKSLVNLRQDISSFIEKSFGYNEFDNDVSGIRALDTTDNVDPASLYGNMRRQSSAFEFSRTAGSYLSAASAAVAPLRRQSSAFEVAARNRLTHKPSMAAYECLNRVGTRSSLRRKNSSVRDLVERLEKKSTFERNTSTSSVISSSSSFTKDQESEDDKKTDDFTKLDDDEWVNGVDFFKNKDRRLASIEMEESGSGCKRSSILRIRKENKGKVSQSVENFTRPVMAPPPTPARRTNQQHDVPSNSHTKSLSLRRQTAHHEGAVKHHAMPTPTNSRRNSARMGVATTPSALTPLQPRNPKRTGIRTSVNHKYAALTSSTPERNLTDRKAPDVKKTNVEVEKHRTVRTSDVPKKQSHQKATATRSNKKNSGERRHLTIGYPGEVRSPLKDRQNMVATVQRSKSAQAPLLSKPKRKSSIQKQQQPENCHCMVTRSQSTRSPSITPAKLAPGSSVRRNKSERSNTKNTPKRYQFQQADRLTPSGRNSRIK